MVITGRIYPEALELLEKLKKLGSDIVLMDIGMFNMVALGS